MDTIVNIKICVGCFHQALPHSYTYSEGKHEKNIFISKSCSLCFENIDNKPYYDMKFNAEAMLSKLVAVKKEINDSKEKLIGLTEKIIRVNE